MATGVGEEEYVVDGLNQFQLDDTLDDERLEEDLLRGTSWEEGEE